MDLMIKLYRPYDRKPSDHLYGEKFDRELDLAVGGASNWSPAREAGTCEEHPTAKIKDKDITIELHEDGPVVSFVLANIDLIPAYVGAIASIISAWAAVRAARAKEVPQDDMNGKSGTVIKVGQYQFSSERNLTPNQVEEMLKSITKLSETA